jgi:hypothetical protein
VRTAIIAKMRIIFTHYASSVERQRGDVYASVQMAKGGESARKVLISIQRLFTEG